MARPDAAVMVARLEAADAASAAVELKSELKRLARAISVEDDERIETYEEASRVLVALKDATLTGNRGSDEKQRVALLNNERIDSDAVPEHFRCPISSELMRDPVVLASGQTYDRPFIQEWLNSGNRTCPQTQQVLPHTILIPNNLVRGMILHWCMEHGVSLPPLKNEQEEGEGVITSKHKNVLDGLLHKICSPSCLMEQKQAISELRLLTKSNRSLRALVGETVDAIPKLFAAVSVSGLSADSEVQEDTVTTILNISIHETNKKILGDNPQAIPFLISALKSVRMETRSNSAAALFSLSALDSNKIRIGEMGAIKPLVELLEQGSLTAKKDAGSAIFSLCMAHENRARAMRGGVLRVVLNAIASRSLVDESLAILALLSGNQEVVEAISEIGAVCCLLSIISENSCARNKENAVVALYSICMYNRKKLREVGEEDDSSGCISLLAQNGTSRARRKAVGILDKWKQTLHNRHYSC
ncbi:U-box domain-containing protein 9 [Canna indica]|uniref:RING-type E3 ubiquitin transferase n=1 Tax=Canna indica TaxID=4628 RepID=A0AAQ3KBD8_9LILI|nr:U-box domain-containing protein 9 [Canna indica]